MTHHIRLRCFLLLGLFIIIATTQLSPFNDTCQWDRISPLNTSDSARGHHLLPYLSPATMRMKSGFPAFIHIAKSGGGTIHSLRFPKSQEKVEMPFSSGVTRFGEGLVCRDGQTPPRDSPAYRGQPTFCVVRHPLSKVISAVKFHNAHAFKSQRQLHPHTHASTVTLKMNALMRRVVVWLEREFARERGSAEVISQEEEEITPVAATMLNSTTTAKAAAELLTAADRCHLIPQSEYVWGHRGERTCSFVLRFEHLAEDFAALAALYGRSVVDEATGKSLLEASRVHASEVDNPWNTFTAADLDADTRRALLRLHRTDLRLLGYDDDPDAPPPPPLLATVATAEKPNTTGGLAAGESTTIKGGRVGGNIGGWSGGWSGFKACAQERDPRIRLPFGSRRGL
jgi:hypothetical protein